MGTWGPKLYQDDLAEDVRDYYKDQLHRGKKGIDITQELLVQYQIVISDSEEASVFWFALAISEWKKGRLSRFVQEKALYFLENGKDLERWNSKGNEKNYKKRKKVLDELKRTILSKLDDIKIKDELAKIIAKHL